MFTPYFKTCLHNVLTIYNQYLKTYLHHVCRHASTMFEDIIIPCIHNIYRYAFIKTLHTIFGDMFEGAFTLFMKSFFPLFHGYLHIVWRHVHTVFEDMFLQMFEAIFIQNWCFGLNWWKWMKKNGFFQNGSNFTMRV